MSTNTEENNLKKVLEDFSTAIAFFQKNELNKTDELMSRLIEDHQDSEHDSVQQIITKARSYRAMIQARLKPVKIKLESEEDFINEGVWLLNSGEFTRSLEVLSEVHKKSPKNPYICYLMAIAHLKKENRNGCLDYLKKAVNLDGHYKILAFNEADFHSISEDEEFISLVEIEDK